MSTYQWKKMDADLLSMVAKVARDEPLSAAEQLSVAEFLKGHAGTEGDWGFSTTPTGDVRGSNNLRRTNWFNGRYLTAEALSRQDVYFDARLRLAAHAQMPGIAWGLGIGAAGANATPVHSESRTGGMPAGQTLTLRRGLAFDHVEIFADAVERARAKLEYSALATAFCAPEFTIAQLRAVYEAVWGRSLDPRNFHRKMTGTPGLLVECGRLRQEGPGRPAALYRAGRTRVLNPPFVREP